MHLKKKGGEGSGGRFTCPETGLPILRRAEWADVDFGREYILTVSVVGEGIVLAQPRGYEEAVRVAVHILSDTYALPALSPSYPPDVLSLQDWHLSLDGFSMKMGIIHGNILHAVSMGFLEESHVPAIVKLREQVNDAISPQKDFDYIVAGVKDLKGANRRARRSGAPKVAGRFGKTR